MNIFQYFGCFYGIIGSLLWEIWQLVVKWLGQVVGNMKKKFTENFIVVNCRWRGGGICRVECCIDVYIIILVQIIDELREREFGVTYRVLVLFLPSHSVCCVKE